jgi:nitrite reductase/ring-hydroxylating ferredoxin subunit
MILRMERIASLDDIPPEGLRITYREGPFDEEAILLKLSHSDVRAYKNECRHLPMRLDEREPSDIWDAERTHLMCSSHGARYRPSDGLCVAGPCQGSHLRELPLVVEGSEVFLDTSKIGGFFNV